MTRTGYRCADPLCCLPPRHRGRRQGRRLLRALARVVAGNTR